MDERVLFFHCAEFGFCRFWLMFKTRRNCVELESKQSDRDLIRQVFVGLVEIDSGKSSSTMEIKPLVMYPINACCCVPE